MAVPGGPLLSLCAHRYVSATTRRICTPVAANHRCEENGWPPTKSAAERGQRPPNPSSRAAALLKLLTVTTKLVTLSPQPANPASSAETRIRSTEATTKRGAGLLLTPVAHRADALLRPAGDGQRAGARLVGTRARPPDWRHELQSAVVLATGGPSPRSQSPMFPLLPETQRRNVPSKRTIAPQVSRGQVFGIGPRQDRRAAR